MQKLGSTTEGELCLGEGGLEGPGRMGSYSGKKASSRASVQGPVGPDGIMERSLS